MRKTNKRPLSGTKKLTLLASVTSAAVLIFGVSACGGGNDEAEEPSLTASRVCDSTLDSSAAEALKRVGNTERFTELRGTNDSGESNTFSLKRAANTLHEDTSQRNQCVVFKAGDKTGHPLIDVDFSAEKHAPDANISGKDGNSEESFYSIGVYAKSSGHSSARLYFKCSTQDTEEPKGSTPYIRASLTSAPGQVSAKSTGRDLMIVLNAISRAMANKLGCASEAALPSEVPEAQVDG